MSEKTVENPKVPAQPIIGRYKDAIMMHFNNMHPQREVAPFHEDEPDFVRLELHVMYPTEEEQFYVLYTVGMSDMEMHLPSELIGVEDPNEFERAELFTFLPATWNPEDETNPENFWPMEMLRYAANLPHIHKSCLGPGDVISNGPEYTPFIEGTELSSLMLIGVGHPNGGFVTKGGVKVNTYYAAPLTRAEAEFRLENGVEALMKLFDEHDVPIIIDTNRKSCV